jgi:hypothetical protein
MRDHLSFYTYAHHYHWTIHNKQFHLNPYGHNIMAIFNAHLRHLDHLATYFLQILIWKHVYYYGGGNALTLPHVDQILAIN